MDSKKKTAVGRRFDESEAQAKLSRIVSKNFRLCDIRLLHNRCTSQKQSTRVLPQVQGIKDKVAEL